jgi:hypothetical protein
VIQVRASSPQAAAVAPRKLCWRFPAESPYNLGKLDSIGPPKEAVGMRRWSPRSIVLGLAFIGVSSLAMAQVPPTAHPVGNEWFCENGFKKVADRCEPVGPPANAHVVGSEWFCDNGFRRNGGGCERVYRAADLPAAASRVGGRRLRSHP